MHGGKGLHSDSSNIGPGAKIERLPMDACCQLPNCALFIEGRQLLTLFLAVLGLLIGGSGTEATTAGQKSYLYTTAAGKEVLTTLPCGNTTDPCNERYRSVTITNDPADEEFWQFEARIMVRAMIGTRGPLAPCELSCAPPRRKRKAEQSVNAPPALRHPIPITPPYATTPSMSPVSA